MKLLDNALFPVLLRLVLTTTILCCVCANVGQGQDKSVGTISNDYYAEVLDLLFPRDIIASENVERVLVVRFEPSFTAESQITIIRKAGRWSAFKHQSESENIYYSLQRILEKGGSEDVSWLAKQVRVSRLEITLSQKQIESLHRAFITGVALELNDEKQAYQKPGTYSADVIADGSKYRIWYRGIGKLEYQLYGTDTRVSSPTYDDHLISWMKRLWREMGGSTVR